MYITTQRHRPGLWARRRERALPPFHQSEPQQRPARHPRLDRARDAGAAHGAGAGAGGKFYGVVCRGVIVFVLITD